MPKKNIDGVILEADFEGCSIQDFLSYVPNAFEKGMTNTEFLSKYDEEKQYGEIFIKADITPNYSDIEEDMKILFNAIEKDCLPEYVVHADLTTYLNGSPKYFIGI